MTVSYVTDYYVTSLLHNQVAGRKYVLIMISSKVVVFLVTTFDDQNRNIQERKFNFRGKNKTTQHHGVSSSRNIKLPRRCLGKERSIKVGTAITRFLKSVE